jgi:hypothetical protein
LHYDLGVVRIEVKKKLGSAVVTREHGKRLRELILDAWADPPIIVDFEGLRINSVSFFDEAIGQIALNHSAQELKKELCWSRPFTLLRGSTSMTSRVN